MNDIAENTIATFKDKDNISINEFVNFLTGCGKMESLETQDIFRDFIKKIDSNQINYGSATQLLGSVINMLDRFNTSLPEDTVYTYLSMVEDWMLRNTDIITSGGKPAHITKMILMTRNMNIINTHLGRRGFTNISEYNEFCKFCIDNKLHESLSVVTHVGLLSILDSNELRIRYC